MKNSNELIIEASPRNLDTVQDFISDRIDGCDPIIRDQIIIAVDEIFSNVAHYAYSAPPGDVTVRILVGEDIIIEFEDSGVEYNPLLKDDPDVTLSAEERDIGGLGIFMVKNIMDKVEYRREGDKNILKIVKWQAQGLELRG